LAVFRITDADFTFGDFNESDILSDLDEPFEGVEFDDNRKYTTLTPLDPEAITKLTSLSNM